MTTLCIEELESNRQAELELWTRARAEMNRILAEHADHPADWVEAQVAAFKRPEMLRSMLAVANFDQA